MAMPGGSERRLGDSRPGRAHHPVTSSMSMATSGQRRIIPSSPAREPSGKITAMSPVGSSFPDGPRPEAVTRRGGKALTL